MQPAHKYRYFLFGLLILISLVFVVFSTLPLIDNGGKIDNLVITNISSNSVTISFSTEKESVAGVLFGEGDVGWIPFLPELGKSRVYDDLDRSVEGNLIAEGPSKRNIHSVTINSLLPEKKYSFKIFAGKRVYNLETDQFTTTSVPKTITSPLLMYGNIYKDRTDPTMPADNTLIHYRIKYNNLVSDSRSTLTNQTGGWVGDLSGLTTGGLPFDFVAEKSVLELTVITEDNEHSITFPAKTDRIQDIFLTEASVSGLQDEVIAQSEASCVGTCKVGIFGLSDPGLNFNYCANPQTKPYSSRTVCIGMDDSCYICNNGNWQGGSANAWRCQGLSCSSAPTPTPNNSKQTKCLNSGGTWIGYCQCYSPEVLVNDSCEPPAQTLCLNSGGSWIGYCQCYSPKVLVGYSCVQPTPTPSPTTDPNLEKCAKSGGYWNGSICTCYPPKVESGGECIRPVVTLSPEQVSCQQSGGDWNNGVCTCFLPKTYNPLTKACQILLPTITPTSQPRTHFSEAGIEINIFPVDTVGVLSAVNILYSTKTTTGSAFSTYILNSDQISLLRTSGKVTVTLSNVDPNNSIILNGVPFGDFVCSSSNIQIPSNEMLEALKSSDRFNKSITFICSRDPVIEKGLFGYADDSLSTEVYNLATGYFPALKDRRIEFKYYNCSTGDPKPYGCEAGSKVLCYTYGDPVFYCNADLIKLYGKIQTKYIFLHEITHINQKISFERLTGAALSSAGCGGTGEMGADLAGVKLATGSLSCTADYCFYDFNIGGKIYKATTAAAELAKTIDSFGALTVEDLTEAFSGKSIDKANAIYGNPAFCSRVSIDETSAVGRLVPDNLFNEINEQTYDFDEHLARHSTLSLPSGQYTVKPYSTEVTNFTEFQITIPENKQGSAQVTLFNDTNNDGIQQNDEKTVPLTGDVEITKTSDSFTYDLVEGWNLVSFPFENDQFIDAKSVFGYFRNNGAPVSGIVKYSDGQFQSFIVDDLDQAFGDNFKIDNRLAYFVKTKTAGKITITGEVTNLKEVNLNKGWNLISLAMLGNESDSTKFLSLCTDQSSSCDLIAKFESGRYLSQIKEAGLLYGNAFNLSGKAGYFVRSTESGKLIDD